MKNVDTKKTPDKFYMKKKKKAVKWEGSKADKAMDKKMGYKEGSKADMASDKKMQAKMKKTKMKKTGKQMLGHAMKNIKYCK